jgi:hypothetical protein
MCDNHNPILAMQTPTPPASESPAFSATDRQQLDDFLQRHPQYQFLPLLELFSVKSSDAYESFFNHVIEIVCWHLQNDAWEGKYLMHILHALFRFRDAFRAVRNAEAWQ